MQNITVSVQSKREYVITLGGSILSSLVDHVEKQHKGKRIVIITDETIQKLHEKTILETLSSFDPFVISLPPGEEAKSRINKNLIEDMLLEKGYGRDTLILAFGGGVIGDLSGYIASTYARGVPVIQIPTTLLAMVDSSVGGKTGINTAHGKNLIGTFYQPDAVFADVSFLESLSKEEFSNGLVESIKIALGLDKDLFEYIEQHLEEILERDKETLMHVIQRSIELKKLVVEKDEQESGFRQILNIGHTIGHALEALSNYSEKHGFCVSKGIIVESIISQKKGLLTPEHCERIETLLTHAGLPTTVDDSVDSEKLIEIMRLDKKSRLGEAYFVLVTDIGEIKSDEDITFSYAIDDTTIQEAISLCKK